LFSLLLASGLGLAACGAVTAAPDEDGAPADVSSGLGAETTGADGGSGPSDVPPVDASPADIIQDIAFDSQYTDTTTIYPDAPPDPDLAIPGDAGAVCTEPQPANTLCADGAWACMLGTFHTPADPNCHDATCEAMSAALQAGMQALLDGAKACAKSADCVHVWSNTSCMGTCGEIVNKAAAGAVAQGVAALAETICKPTDYPAKCGYATPGCIAPNPACVAGLCTWGSMGGSCPGDPPPNTTCAGGAWKCDAGFFKPTPTADCVPATCEAMDAARNQAISDLVEQLATCAADSECSVTSISTDCQGACGAAIRIGKTDEFEMALKAINQALCVETDYVAKCGYATPKCLAPDPGCVAGMCVYTK